MNDRKFSMGYDSHETLPSILNYDDTANGKKRMTLEELRRERVGLFWYDTIGWV